MVVGSPCESAGEGDVKTGARVVIEDAYGEIVGVGNLGQGKYGRPDPASEWSYQCSWDLTIQPTALDSDYYTVRVGDSLDVVVNLDELRRGPELTQGGI